MWRFRPGPGAVLLPLCAILAGCDGLQHHDLGGDFQEEDVTDADRRVLTATDISGWDENDDALLQDSEWAAYAREGFDDGGWDEDRDGAIGQEEFASGTVRAWDANRDGAVDEDEWRSGLSRWQEESASDFASLDRDASGALDAQELGRGNGAFSRWDVDGSGGIDPREWGDRWLDVHDRNGDRAVDADEMGAGPGWNP